MLRTGLLALVGLVAGCATATRPGVVTRPSAPVPTPAIPVELASESSAPPLDPAWIGKADLEKTRELLAQAREALEPNQLSVLENKLVEAEGAWTDFNRLASEGGKVAEVARSAEGLAEARRMGEAREPETPARVGPLLALLLMLRPAPTAEKEFDEIPPWLAAKQAFEVKLEELAEASRQVQAEIEAARKQPRKDAPKPAPREPKGGPGREPKPQSGGQGQGGGDPPCIHNETRGRAAFRGGAKGLMTCGYKCGGEQVYLPIWGNSVDDCEEPQRFREAADKAAKQRAQKQGR